jgi:hypothetical protein
MNIQGAAPFAPAAQAGVAGTLTLLGGDDFAAKLQLGQIIKGRVLRHYAGTRYGVEFNGREKVVDSAVPLQTGEILYGKVAGIGDKVELDRVRPAAPQRPEPAADARPRPTPADAALPAAAILEQLQASLPAEQANALEQLMRGAGDKQAMALSGLLLSKLGIAMAPELLRAVAELLRTRPERGLFALGANALQLDAGDSGAQAPADPAPVVAALAQALQQLVEASPEQEAWESMLRQPDRGGDESGQAGASGDRQQQGAGGFDLGRWLLNVQTGGSVGHRVNTVPLLVNGRLVELDIAVFEQRQGRRDKEETRHRQLAFSLCSEQLGNVEARLTVTGSHIKVTFGTEREASAEWLSAHAPELMAQLKNDGWHVDALDYEARPAQAGGVARTVLQHVVTQDSVSVLV